MKTFPYVEDYLEYLAGYDYSSNGLTTWNYLPEDRKINLARIDVNVVDSIANSTTFGQALTDRQAELVCKLVLKYRKQFLREGIDIEPVEAGPIYRLPLRYINRSRKIWIESEIIHIYFPYDKKMVDSLKEYRKSSIGNFQFNYDDKIWKIAVTEHNVNWIVTWGEINNFEIDTSVRKLFDLILECEKTLYSIKLVKTENGFTIVNAAQSLLEYVDLNLGGFGHDNVNQLVDYSGVLGYEVDPDILTLCNESVLKFGLKYSQYFTPDTKNLKAVLTYAIETNKNPIVIYQPAATVNTQIKSIVDNFFNKDEIVHIDITGKICDRQEDINTAKVIFVEKFPKEVVVNKISLLITYHELLHGTNKQNWLNSAERIVYMCNSALRKQGLNDVE